MWSIDHLFGSLSFTCPFLPHFMPLPSLFVPLPPSPHWLTYQVWTTSWGDWLPWRWNISNGSVWRIQLLNRAFSTLNIDGTVCMHTHQWWYSLNWKKFTREPICIASHKGIKVIGYSLCVHGEFSMDLTDAISAVKYLCWTKKSAQCVWIWRDLVSDVLYDGQCRALTEPFFEYCWLL